LIIGSIVKTMPGAQAHALAALADVRDLRRLVERPADAVAHEGAHHRAALAFGVLLDGRADVAEPRAFLHLRDRELEALARDLRHLARLRRRLADVEGGRGVAVETLVDRRDVDVDDVAVLEHLAPRDAVADDLVDEVQTLFGKPW
jgi:hypothetical protein